MIEEQLQKGTRLGAPKHIGTAQAFARELYKEGGKLIGDCGFDHRSEKKHLTEMGYIPSKAD